MRKLSRFVAASFVLAACSNRVVPPPEVVPELAVQQLSPAAGSVVSPHMDVGVVFGEDVDPSTLQPENLRVEDGSGELPGSYRYLATSRIWLFTADDELPRGMPLRATLTTGVRSPTGARLPQDRSWEFTVQDGLPQLPVDLGTPLLGSGRFAAMQDGVAMLGYGSSVYESTASGLLGATPLPDIVQGLHVARTGAVTALCAATTGWSFELSLRRRPVGGVFGAPQVIETQPRSLTSVNFIVNGRGDVGVRWTAVSGVPAANSEGFVRVDASAPQALASVDLGATELVRYLGFDGEGALYHGVPSTGGVRVQRVAADGSRAEVAIPAPNARLAGIGADGPGRMLALYSTGTGATADLRTRRYHPQQGLGGEQIVYTGSSSIVRFQVGERGDGVLCLAVPVGPNHELWAATWSQRSAAWSPARPVLAPASDFHDGGFVAATVTARGISWLCAVRPLGVGQELVLLRAAPGGVFGAPVRVATTGAGVRFLRPAVAGDDSGRAVVLYQERTLANTAIGALHAAHFQ